MFQVFTETEKAVAKSIAADLTAMFSGFVTGYELVKPYAIATAKLTAEYSAIVYKDLSSRVTPEDIAAAKAFCMDVVSLVFMAGVVIRRRCDRWIDDCQVDVPKEVRRQLREFDAEIASAPTAVTEVTIEQLEAEISSPIAEPQEPVVAANQVVAAQLSATATQPTDAELIAAAKAMKYPGAGKWARTRKLRASEREGVIAAIELQEVAVN